MDAQEMRIAGILDFLDEGAKQKIKILQDGILQNRKKYEKNYASVALRAWKAAERELNDLLDDFEDAQGESICETFSGVPNVHKYLTGAGWKISRAQVYNHQKLGYLMPDKKGRYRMDKVDLYAEKYLHRLDGVDDTGKSSADPKRLADIRKSEAQADHWELRTKVDAGLYVPRDLFERELAARAVVIKSDMLNFCMSKASEIVAKCKGDSTTAPELIDYLVKHVEKFLDRYAHDPQGTFKK